MARVVMLMESVATVVPIMGRMRREKSMTRMSRRRSESGGVKRSRGRVQREDDIDMGYQTR